ncbi:MAG: glycosyl hydrolase [candidate division KSB1 bacterium]|nr:glycosyl hydrolase [candidate division KSB1 bacterium]
MLGRGKCGALGLLMGAIFAIATVGPFSPSSAQIWPEMARESRPGTYWWWMGSAVDSTHLRHNLLQLHQAGIGGVLVIPIYGVRGYEAQFVDFLGPRWMALFSYAVAVAESLGMWLDMSTGTGWPFGGSHVRPEFAAKGFQLVRMTAALDHPAELEVDPTSVRAAEAYGPDGSRQSLLAQLAQSARLKWCPPSGTWQIVVLLQKGTGQRVKRAAPGNEGWVLDPFSPRAMRYYLQRFDTAFAVHGSPWPRCHYHDSYEYYGANWTDDLLREFEVRRGYRLEDHLPAFAGLGAPDTVARVKADYRATLSELHLDYLRTWVEWARAHGSRTRNEAHGAPANLLDLYAAADIPETETFGSTPFPIPGLRRLPGDVREEVPNPLILRFASSAAHVSGRRLVAAETCTWLREHFRTALSMIKPEIDQLFLAGINHVQYHGTAYSPAEAPWPGWLFYASVHFQPTNPIWRDLPALNAYVQRCQAVLQAGLPDNDVLFYWPVHDIWHDTTGYQRQLTVHFTAWVDSLPYGALAKELLSLGYTFDFVSDGLLGAASVESGRILLGGTSYEALVVPECRLLPLETWRRLEALARQGACVLFHRHLPQDVPGLANLERRRLALRQAQGRLAFRREGDLAVARLGKGKLVVGEQGATLLGAAGVQAEELIQLGVGVIRRRVPDGHFYFLANLGDREVDRWVKLARPFRHAYFLDPLTGKWGKAAVRGAGPCPEVYVQLRPGQSAILRTFQTARPEGPYWDYWKAQPDTFEVPGPWRVTFVEGGPTLPAGFETERLGSWTRLGDPEAERFAGTALYATTFRWPGAAADAWLLDLGDVRESARVRLNGIDIGVAWALPFVVVLTDGYKRGWNSLELEVTNLAANRIRDVDRRGIPWKIFYDINFVNLRYRPFDASDWEPVDSGLLGPVRLIPLRRLRLERSG